MASVADLCNMALSHVGDDAIIASIDPPDGSVQAGYCARFYPIARRSAIEAGAFNFALARAELAQVSNPSTVWSYAYALPADCIKPLRILQANDIPAALAAPSVFDLNRLVRDYDTTETMGSQFTIEGATLYTHEAEPVLIYRRDVTDTTRFTPTFSVGLSYMLGALLAGPIIKGMEGIRVGQALQKIGLSMLAEAAVLEANSGTETHDPLPSSIRARQ